MCALAHFLKSQNEIVMGSDVANTFFTDEKLKDITVLTFQKENIINNSDAYFIISYAYNEENNIEVKTIIENNYNYKYYSDFINDYSKGIVIGVSGTHGKTTTSKLIVQLFKQDKISYVIGDGTGGGIIDYKYFLIEACEYKHHFIKYNYDYLIINNIEYDHPDFYNNIEEVYQAFSNASTKAKRIIVNNDSLAKNINHDSKITYGIFNNSFVKGNIISITRTGFLLNIQVENNSYNMQLPFFGIHMIYNFLAAFTLYYLTHQEIDIDLIKQLMKNYELPSRRCEEYIIGSNIIIDDYAHHPTEIESTYKAIKQKYPDHDITIVFQPHTYSRTIFLSDEFINVFRDKKAYYIKTFLSREEYDPLKEIVVNNVFKNLKEYNEKEILDILKQKNQIILFMGAGNIYDKIKEIKYNIEDN